MSFNQAQMDGNGGLSNPRQVSQTLIKPFASTGLEHQAIMFPPPPLQQPYQNFPNQYFPPPFPPPSVPPPTSLFFSHPPPPVSERNSYSAPCSIESECVKFETSDKEWLSDWLAQRNIQCPLKKIAASASIMLVDVQSLFLHCSLALKELQVLHHNLSKLSSCADEAKWNTLLAEVNEKKAALSLLLGRIHSLDVAAIRAKLSKRARKRGWLQRKRDKVRASKKAEQARRKMLHRRADAWLAEMKLTTEREHREEELRREADAVLGEVTRKQTEAKREISVFDALIKLRKVRAQRATMHVSNQGVDDHFAKKFATVIERLRKLWDMQLKEYACEERGLRVMLHESAAQKSDARCQRMKSTIDQWHKGIFGESVNNIPAKQNINELISVRMEWDKFVVHFGANAPMASTIPVGWVLPQEPSSDLWRPYCVAYDKDE